MVISQNTHPEKRPDVNGKIVTRHVSSGKPSVTLMRVSTIAAPPKPPLEEGYTSALDRVISNTPLKEMSPSLLGEAIKHKFPTERVSDAIAMASYLHRHETRGSRGNQPREEYIAHPLRNALRVIRYGCEDEDVVIANILHDTVEDEPESMIAIEYPGLDISEWSEKDKQDFAIEHVVAPMFGDRVAHIVRKVTNEPLPKSMSKAEKQALYRDKVLKSISDEDDGVVLTKAPDIQDNAGSLHHHFNENRGMVISLAKKYHPLFGPLIERVERVEILSDEAKALFVYQLREIEKRLDGFRQLEN